MTLDLTNVSYGKYTVVEPVGKDKRGRLWKALCGCGTEFVRAANDFNYIDSCGCLISKPEDLTGMQFGELTVLQYKGRRSKSHAWLTECSCGTERIFNARSLKQGKVTYCMRKEHSGLCHEDFKKNTWLKKTYGITIHDYYSMLANQNGRCAICHEKPDEVLYVDHCHESGNVRALLCNACNNLLGYAREDVSILLNALKFLQNF